MATYPTFYALAWENPEHYEVCRFDSNVYRLLASSDAHKHGKAIDPMTRDEAEKAMRRRAPGLRGHWHQVPGAPGVEVWARCSPEEALRIGAHNLYEETCGF